MSYRDCKLYVGNLSSSANRTDLEKEFGYYGHLVNVWVARNPPGFAYVEFEDARDAKDAVRGLDGRTILGRKLRVEVAHGMTRSRGGGAVGGWGGGGGNVRRAFDPNDRCYNCGESGHYAYDCALYRRSNRRRSRSRSRSRSRRSRSRSRSGRRRKSVSKSPKRSYSRSRSRSPRRRSRSPSHSPRRSASRSRSRSGSRGYKERSPTPPRNCRSASRSRSRSRSH